jgi:RNA ligase (TIGR02306 family)
MRQLATIQSIISIEPIAGADAIEVASVLGWKVVVRKEEGYKAGDQVVYIEIDSLLPLEPWSDFLFKDEKEKARGQYRLKTVKLRGQVSQGLIVPLTTLVGKKYENDTRENPVYPQTVGTDVTGLLRIMKFEPPIPACLAGTIKGQFPCFIPKTDETRVQAAPDVLKEIAGKPCYITTKMDGSSGTFYHNRGEFGVCSRNLEFTEDGDNTFWKVAKKYDLKTKLAALGRNIALQGEVCGPGIQKNRLELKDHDLFIFNVYDIDLGRYMDMKDFVTIVRGLEVPTVPVDSILDADDKWTIEQLLNVAKGCYPGTKAHREGIVIRPLVECQSRELKGRMSFKVINNDFLLKGGE